MGACPFLTVKGEGMSLYSIALGSNMGNRLANLGRAVALLEERYFSRLKLSPVLETPALLPANAPADWDIPYLNMVVRGTSDLSPEALLAGLKDIEKTVGREETHERWGPRLIDLDIVLWDGPSFISPTLTIPHVELLNRPFLIHLLALLDPQCRYPGGKTFGEMAHLLPDIDTCYTQSFVLNPKLVGIVNLTPDSFSDGGQYVDPEKAISHAKQLVAEGATVVELGPQSTRPQAVLVDAETEYARLHPILEGLSDDIKQNDITISLDSFLPETILKVLENYPISWINDVTGNLEDRTLRTIAERGLKIVVMHSLSIPPPQRSMLGF